ncbi:hypothetical protein TEA_003285 [Camellia sinensis var. sinensis]|uniref:Uncharacterized protein n=1 Tax=Camellia sinensis var. sinensis TaxID=542762 RepID=A0A4V3WLE6_CAMSN|nr:hypothetical protein TEA_003285 [Camellia sinensis var. sinensis]
MHHNCKPKVLNLINVGSRSRPINKPNLNPSDHPEYYSADGDGKELLIGGESLLSDGKGKAVVQVPRGYLAVYVGPELQRYVIPACYLSMPEFMELMEKAAEEFGYQHDGGLSIPNCKSFCPPIYPLGDQLWQLNEGVPLICLHSLQVQPFPAPPSFASQTVVDCQPLMGYASVISVADLLTFICSDNYSFKHYVELKDVCVEGAMATADGSKSFCPPIYPLGDQLWQLNEGVPLICLHSLQVQPFPAPPSFASQTVVDCQPLMGYASVISVADLLTFICSDNYSFKHYVELKDVCVEGAMATADGSPLLIR